MGGNCDHDEMIWIVQHALANDNAGLYGLPKPNLIRKEVTLHRILEDTLDDAHLMGLQFNGGGE
ncbi:hypothetical protein GMPD_37980 [Geomonas paludis]|uniref:Uncharacterized protein n=1 Tax=Geomonas paludis TaxID=2740185 RepID=A0A6V8N3K9_9BACT|nr:hypothetical protein GMPD_37980 [Geomonas paludis]